MNFNASIKVFFSLWDLNFQFTSTWDWEWDWDFFLQVLLGIVEFLKIGIWLHMEHQSQLNMMILQSNLFLPATWNVRMDVLDQEQISVMSVNTSEEVPVR